MDLEASYGGTLIADLFNLLAIPEQSMFFSLKSSDTTRSQNTSRNGICQSGKWYYKYAARRQESWLLAPVMTSNEVRTGNNKVH